MDKVDREKQEPRISLTLDEEDLVRRPPPGSDKAPPPPAQGGGGTGFVLFVLTVLVLALAAGGYFLFEQLQQSRKQLELAQQRLDSLESRLSSADESLEENSLTTSVKLKELDSEVRKLWDNVWKKQKETLAEHEAQLAKNEKRLVAIEAQGKKNEELVGRAMKGYQADRETMTSMAGKLDRVIAQAEVNRNTLLDVNKQLSAGGSLDARVNALEKRVGQTEDWLDSVNAFRTQVNRDIDALRRTMSQYHSGSPQPR